MPFFRLNDDVGLSPAGRTITRRVLLVALGVVGLDACGRKGPLELPPEDQDNPDNPEPKSVEDPDTYGDPMTFPEPGEDEESAE
jgi:predicted small lipoprotein YifL